MKDANFRRYDIGRCSSFLGGTDHSFSRRNVHTMRVNITQPDTVDELSCAATFRMNEDLCVGMLGATRVYRSRIDALVHMAFAHPNFHASVRSHAPDVRTEKEIREEQDATILWDGVYNVQHVAACVAVVELGLYLCTCVYVTHGNVFWKLRLPPAHVRGRDG